MNTTRDAALLNALCKGDEKAFDLIFETYYWPLVGFAFKHLQDWDNARLIVQDCFVYLWEKKSYLTIQRSLIQVLYTSVSNRCVSFERKHRAERKRSQGYLRAHPPRIGENDPIISTFVGQESPEGAFNSILDLVFTSCKSLPPQQYATIDTIYFQKKTYKEAAQLLCKSENTVNTNLQKGKLNLRKQLSKVLKNI